MTKNSKHLLGMRIVVIARRWRQFLDDRLSASGLSDATWAPLVHLHRADGWLHHKDLAARIGLDVSSLVRLLDKLEEQGLIERCQDPADRRAKRLSLTAAGKHRVDEIMGVVAQLEEELLQDVDDRTAEAMMSAFSRIEERLEGTKDNRDNQ